MFALVGFFCTADVGRAAEHHSSSTIVAFSGPRIAPVEISAYSAAQTAAPITYASQQTPPRPSVAIDGHADVQATLALFFGLGLSAVGVWLARRSLRNTRRDVSFAGALVHEAVLDLMVVLTVFGVALRIARSGASQCASLLVRCLRLLQSWRRLLDVPAKIVLLILRLQRDRSFRRQWVRQSIRWSVTVLVMLATAMATV